MPPVSANIYDYLNDLLNKSPLFVFALPEEAGEEFREEEVLFSGVGKINAAHSLTKKLLGGKYSIVVNLGSAGSNAFKKDDIVCCTHFVQRDMDVTPLGFAEFKTPYSEDEIVIAGGLKARGMIYGTCGSGDNFETSHNHDLYNVVDMEAYSLALVCLREQVPFLCLKYITDGADEGAGNDWQTSLHEVAKYLKESIEKIK